ncbi:MAG: hypothetical protein KC776_42235 [Myxococcales bacterium]|nr:hypothetical protein [Myxococcales bacterium]MCB9578422.1 hypothetical protein [Polyangiaceae bacterium]
MKSTLVIFGLVLLGCSQSSGSYDASGAGGGGVPVGGGAGGGGGGAFNATEESDRQPMDQSDGEPDRGQPLSTGACDGLDTVARVVDAVVSDSDDSASATGARASLTDGRSPSPLSVRTQDFLNLYPPALPATVEPLSVSVDLRPSLVPGFFELAAMVHAAPSTEPLPPLVAVALLDTSKEWDDTMTARAKLVLDALSPKVQSLAVLTTDPSVEPATDIGALSLSTGGDLNEGLTRAYDMAFTSGPEDATRRVFLLGPGSGDPTSLDTAFISERASAAVLLHTVGIGSPDATRELRSAARYGHGSYSWVGDAEDASRVIGDRVDGLFRAAYTDVRLNLTLPWYFSIVSPESEQTVSTDQAQPQSLAAGETMVFPFKIAACDATVVDAASVVDVSLSATSMADGERKTVALQKSLAELESADHTALQKVMVVYQYAEALKTLDPVRLAAARSSAEDAAQTATDPDLTKIAGLIALHPALQ